MTRTRIILSRDAIAARLDRIAIVTITAVGVTLLAPDACAMNVPEVQQLVFNTALENGVVPPALALAVARVESDFNPDAVSSADAIGVMQILSSTGMGEFGLSREELFNPHTNVRAGVDFLHQSSMSSLTKTPVWPWQSGPSVSQGPKPRSAWPI